VTKIKLQIEIELPDDHQYSVSGLRDGRRILSKETVAQMVKQNILDLLNNAFCDELEKRLDIISQKNEKSAEMYKALIDCSKADVEVWRQISSKAQIAVEYT
jgi:hypothetical protein